MDYCYCTQEKSLGKTRKQNNQHKKSDVEESRISILNEDSSQQNQNQANHQQNILIQKKNNILQQSHYLDNQINPKVLDTCSNQFKHSTMNQNGMKANQYCQVCSFIEQNERSQGQRQSYLCSTHYQTQVSQNQHSHNKRLDDPLNQEGVKIINKEQIYNPILQNDGNLMIQNSQLTSNTKVTVATPQYNITNNFDSQTFVPGNSQRHLISNPNYKQCLSQGSSQVTIRKRDYITNFKLHKIAYDRLKYNIVVDKIIFGDQTINLITWKRDDDVVKISFEFNEFKYKFFATFSKNREHPKYDLCKSLNKYQKKYLQNEEEDVRVKDFKENGQHDKLFFFIAKASHRKQNPDSLDSIPTQVAFE